LTLINDGANNFGDSSTGSGESRRVVSVGVEVVDHGDGVALQDRDKIFESFWLKSEATPGAGLGLSISKELIDKHSGCICVVDTDGGGATFRVLLTAPLGLPASLQSCV
jgi:signal transduction histidine kinase